MKYKVGDNVKVIAGDQKGSSGKIIKIFKSKNKALVEGINMVKKHVKTTKEKKGGIFSKEDFIHISNLKLVEEKIRNKKKEAKK